MKKIFTSLALPMALTLAACSGKNSDLAAPPPKPQEAVTVEAPQTASVEDPKVNILFVVDNSGSMKNYQAKMAANIQQFARHFFANSRIDYRIGVVPVYDSKYLNDHTMYNSGLRKMNPLGELVALKGRSPEDKSNHLYITRETLNPEEVLKQTVLIGTQWGPEAEESFSPVLAVADDKINSTINENFYQKDAYLAVIFLTDADDVTPGLSGESFFQKLVDLKGGDRSKILTAAALPNIASQSESCKTDGRGPIQAFPALLAVSGATFADLCSDNFGEHLATFGRYLTQRVSSQKIPLGFTPDINTLKVTYGPRKSRVEERMVLSRGADGYYFDPKTDTVVLSPTMKIEKKPDSVIFVEAIPANLGNYKNGRTRRI